MKTISKSMILTMVALVAISVGATYAITNTTSLNTLTSTEPSANSGAFMTGHVEAIVRDNNGVIKAYRQADNAIVRDGLKIIASQVFQPASFNGHTIADGLNNNTNQTGGRIGWMNIGNGSSVTYPPDAEDKGLRCPLKLGYSGFGCGGTPKPNCNAIASDIWVSNATKRLTGPPINVAQINVTAIATFDGLNCDSKAIQEAGIWNNSTTPAANGQMFARNTFGSVTLTTTDSLQLTWRFTFTDQ